MVRRPFVTLGVGLVALTAAALVGCSAPAPESTPPATPAKGEHAHKPGAHGGHTEPEVEKVTDDEERKLYLTPGGVYTDADIAANGSATASQKFKGIKAAHDVKPQPGDKLCPISMTKANPKFSWVVGGKVYEFCCPPCVDEFLALAKEKPAEVKPPDFYIKK